MESLVTEPQCYICNSVSPYSLVTDLGMCNYCYNFRAIGLTKADSCREITMRFPYIKPNIKPIAGIRRIDTLCRDIK